MHVEIRETIMCRGSPESFTITPIESEDVIIRKHEYTYIKQHDHHMQHDDLRLIGITLYWYDSLFASNLLCKGAVRERIQKERTMCMDIVMFISLNENLCVSVSPSFQD